MLICFDPFVFSTPLKRHCEPPEAARQSRMVSAWLWIASRALAMTIGFGVLARAIIT